MTDGAPTRLSTVVLCLACLLIFLGALWYGLSSENLHRQWQNLTGRSSGPMTFRFLLQPTIAAIAALHDGIRDAQLGRSPYFWTVLHNSGQRHARLVEGLNATARIILLGIGMDIIYQLKEFDALYPVEALIIALALAFVPYLLLRGPAARAAHWWRQRPAREGYS